MTIKRQKFLHLKNFKENFKNLKKESNHNTRCLAVSNVEMEKETRKIFD